MTRVLTCLMVSLSLAACGKAPTWVKEVSVRSFAEGNHHFGELTTKVEADGLRIQFTELPIVGFDGRKSYGKVVVRPEMSGRHEVVITVNMSDVVRLPEVHHEPFFPNGTMMPLEGADPFRLMIFPLGDGQSRAYVNLSPLQSSALFGVSLVMRNMQPSALGKILYPFAAIDNQMHGVAGVFTGGARLQSGFTILADMSKIFEIDGVHEQLLFAQGVHPAEHRSKTRGLEPSRDRSTTRADTELIQEELKRLKRERVILEVD
jgi:hypothetical protein